MIFTRVLSSSDLLLTITPTEKEEKGRLELSEVLSAHDFAMSIDSKFQHRRRIDLTGRCSTIISNSTSWLRDLTYSSSGSSKRHSGEVVLSACLLHHTSFSSTDRVKYAWSDRQKFLCRRVVIRTSSRSQVSIFGYRSDLRADQTFERHYHGFCAIANRCEDICRLMDGLSTIRQDQVSPEANNATHRVTHIPCSFAILWKLVESWAIVYLPVVEQHLYAAPASLSSIR